MLLASSLSVLCELCLRLQTLTKQCNLLQVLHLFKILGALHLYMSFSGDSDFELHMIFHNFLSLILFFSFSTVLWIPLNTSTAKAFSILHGVHGRTFYWENSNCFVKSLF